MELYGIQTPIIKTGDNLLEMLFSAITQQELTLEEQDILVIAEIVVATAQGRIRQLEKIDVSPEAEALATRYQLEPELAQLVIDESEEILGGVPHVLLTIKNNTLMANAGIDERA